MEFTYQPILVAYALPPYTVEDLRIVPIDQFDVSLKPYIIAFCYPKSLYRES